MPTILINTNLSASKFDDSGKENGNENDFKQDLNSIITKLLAKSETMDSFLVKYDIDDVIKSKENTSMSSCVCKRLANIFSEVLNKPTQATESNGPSSYTSSSNEEMKEINSELKRIRNFQSDLSNKFNLVMNTISKNSSKVSDQNYGTHNNNQSQINGNRHHHNNQHKVPLRTQHSTNAFHNNTNNLPINGQITGAKKRKNPMVTKNEIELIDDDLNENSQDNYEVAELEDEHIQCLIEEDLDMEEEPHQLIQDTNEILRAKLIDEHRDCSSGMSSATTNSSKYSNTKKNSNENTKAVNDNQELDDNLEHIENEIHSDLEIAHNNEEQSIQEIANNKSINSRNRNNNTEILEDDFTLELDGNSENNNALDNEDISYIDYQQYSNSNDTGKDPLFYNSSNNRNQNSGYINSIKQPPVYKFNNTASSSRMPNNNNNGYNPKQYSPVPNKKFRFINQSPTPHNSYQTQQTQPQNCYSIPNRPAQQQQQQPVKINHQQFTPNTRSNFEIKTELGRINSYSQISNNFNETQNDSKFKQNNMPKLSPNSEDKSSIKSEQTTDIDINELFKDGGPRFLQMELYKDFKPPILFMDDNYYIDNTLATSAYSKSKSRRNFAAHLAKLVFTPRERLESNCNGRFGKKALDINLLNSIRNTLFKFYPCKQSTLVLNGDTITSGDNDENSVWVRDCIPAIDESNRVLKKQLIAWYKKSHIPKPGVNISGNSSFVNNNSSCYSPVGTSQPPFTYSDSFRPLGGVASNASNDEFEANNCLNDEENEEDFNI